MLSLLEALIHLARMELRTFLQVPKGLFLWLVTPCVLLWQANVMMKFHFAEAGTDSEGAVFRSGRFKNWMRRILVILAGFAISLAALYRSTDGGNTFSFVKIQK